MALLDVANLSKTFGGIHAVRDVSFALEAGELLALIGPNGAGKTTCFNCINGQIRPDAGSVRLDRRELVGLAPRAVWRLGVARTFQVTQTFGSLTVLENVQATLVSRHRRILALWPSARALYRAPALELLERVAMREQADRACGVLAYGDLKRVELAIALAGEPKLLLMDEPTAGMAPRERTDLMALIRDLAKERRTPVLFTEHDMDVVFNHADRIMVMHRGELIAAGTPAEVRADPTVQETYLGAGALPTADAEPADARSG